MQGALASVQGLIFMFNVITTRTVASEPEQGKFSGRLHLCWKRMLKSKRGWQTSGEFCSYQNCVVDRLSVVVDCHAVVFFMLCSEMQCPKMVVLPVLYTHTILYVRTMIASVGHVKKTSRRTS